jgi:polyribonucleotide nucleotidyltransferase
MLLSADGQYDADMLSIVAASTALTLSEIPFMGPLAGVRVARSGDKFIVNPTHAEREGSDLELVYAGTREHTMMIEGGAKEISESDLIAAMKVAQEAVTKIVDLQLELRAKLGLPEKKVVVPEKDTTLLDAANEIAGESLSELLRIPGKLERQKKVEDAGEELKAAMQARFPEMSDEDYRSTFDDLEIDCVRKNVLERGHRIDGRASKDIRPLSGVVSVLPRTHGSAIFMRGETQALATITLGTKSDKQNMDAVTGGETQKRFMLHYNFPPYSVGEVGRLGMTNRREMGHGALAERSLSEVIPSDYPYTIRVVADIMGSNGSTSMASVCAGTLALLDAGVPIIRPVAGISVGMFGDGDRYELVTDILGAEDHCGDMDFKVAGTREGVTSFQVDLKVHGMDWDLVEKSFAQAKEARLEILDAMDKVISTPREEMSPHAPRIEEIKIDPEKIGELIGPGGRNIRGITEVSGAQVDISEDGTVSIFATNSESMEIAKREVMLTTAEAEEGAIYEGTVTGVKEFGAFVEILPGRDGLVHISELADCRVNRVEDVCNVGDTMWVKCIGIDDRGRVKLSRKEAMQERDEAAQE